MNKHQVKGMANKVTGEVKEQVGKMTGDESLRARGHAREMKGKAQEKLGNAREVLKEEDREVRDRELAERDMKRHHN